MSSALASEFFSPIRGNQPIDQLRIGRGEFEVTKLFASNPADILYVNGFGITRNNAAVKKTKAHCLLGITMREFLNLFGDGNFDAEFLMNFPNEARRESFARFDFAAGELPEIRQMIVRPALGDEEFAVVKYQRCGNVDRFHSDASDQREILKDFADLL
jgi:hypothetical protein